MPGALFVYLCKYIVSYSLIQKDIIIGLFLYYFIGLVISRLGSLIIEPLLKKIKFIKFRPNHLYIKASKLDTTLETISEQNNIYRTISSLLVLIILVKIYEVLKSLVSSYANYEFIIILIALSILFLLSYRKQTKYVVSRIDAALDNKRK